MRRGLVLALMMLFGVVSPVSAEVMVYTPGGMSDAMERVAALAAVEGVRIKVVSGHSPAHARQILEDAPADIFISADPQWMDLLREKDRLAAGSEAVLASTRLVVIAPRQSPLRYDAQPGESLAAGLGDGRLAIGDPDSLPAGRYARRALQTLGAWDDLSGRLALLPHVRGVIAMVEREEAAAGIGYANDVTPDRKVRVVATFPDEAGGAIVFPIAIVKGHDGAEVRAAYDLIRGHTARGVLRDHGYLTAP